MMYEKEYDVRRIMIILITENNHNIQSQYYEKTNFKLINYRIPNL